MRIPLPERFKLRSTIVFVAAVVIAQQLEHTDVTFSLLTAVYILLFTIGFNVGGGLYYLAGAFIFFNGTIGAIVGILYKIVLGEPGQSNLLEPNRTMTAYCLGMAGMGLAAFFSRRFVPKTGILAGMAGGEQMKQAAIGCFVFGIVLQVVTIGGGDSLASFSSAVGQLNHFIQMAIILGTTYQIQHSKGKSSSNWVVWAAGLWIFFFGVIVFSKEGMFTSAASWLIPAVALNFNFTKKQVILGALAVYLMMHYLVPFSQYGRNFRAETGSNVQVAYELLRHPEETRRLYLEEEAAVDSNGGNHYFDTPQGIFDREQMLSPDDALIEYTDQGNIRGIEPTVLSFENVVPRFLWTNKPTLNFANEYGRDVGVIGPEDYVTSISFSLIADAYHQALWLGVCLLVPIVTFLLFVVGDSLAGDTRKSPWGLLLIALSSHNAPEGLMSGVIYLLTYGAFAVTLIALMSKYALPIFSNLLTGSDRTRVRRTIEFAPSTRGSRMNPILRPPDPELPPRT